MAREFLWVIGETKKYLKTLLKLPKTELITPARTIIFLTVVTLHEEGITPFNVTDVMKHSGLSKSTVYRTLRFFTKKKVLNNIEATYTCNAKIPPFLLNPKDLYERPLEFKSNKGNKEYQQQIQIEEAVKNVLSNIQSNDVVEETVEYTSAGNNSDDWDE